MKVTLDLVQNQIHAHVLVRLGIFFLYCEVTLVFRLRDIRVSSFGRDKEKDHELERYQLV